MEMGASNVIVRQQIPMRSIENANVIVGNIYFISSNLPRFDIEVIGRS